MSDKINIQKILVKHCGDWFLQGEKEGIIAAIQEIVEAVIDKCADNADVSWAGTPDGQSILNVKKMIDYD